MMLKYNSTLQRLFLPNNYFGQRGGTYIALALCQNKTLTTLDISLNRIGQKGLEAFSAVIVSNNTLETLHLSEASFPRESSQIE
mmetsp:Transcript_1851/g.1956  ORF Transcript_1851/g.1956 Transcript_1851/m.1956 type:complete len:84 (-) Transcript_1851:546-797(-)